MSLILEALRKSEAERRRGQTPDLHAELPPSPRARTMRVPRWQWWLPAAVVLLLASVLIGRWIARAPASSEQAPTVAVVEPGVPGHASATAALPEIGRLSPREPAIPQPRETPGPHMADAPAKVQPAEPPPQAPIPQAPAAPVPQAPAASTSSAPEVLQLSDLSADERTSLPPLRISMHMWNDDPSRRFVIIDGNRLGEGDRIGNAVVAAITPDGVLLDWNGRRIRLPIR